MCEGGLKGLTAARDEICNGITRNLEVFEQETTEETTKVNEVATEGEI